jgi:hypothetical protein
VKWDYAVSMAYDADQLVNVCLELRRLALLSKRSMAVSYLGVRISSFYETTPIQRKLNFATQ